jgi:(1->4)-alpha-D-glucan 1-alpha-D-glucosylmutase
MVLRRGKLTYAGRIVRELARGGSAPPMARSRRVQSRAGPRAKPAQTPKTSLTIPGATYRFQFNNKFKFSDAEALVPYLKDLGITHC